MRRIETKMQPIFWLDCSANQIKYGRPNASTASDPEELLEQTGRLQGENVYSFIEGLCAARIRDLRVR